MRHKWEEVEVTQTFNVEWIKKMCIIYSALKIQGNTVTCYNTDEPWGHYTKYNKPLTERQILYNSTHVTYLKYSKIIETEFRKVVAKGWGGREIHFFGYRVSILQDVKVLADFLHSNVSILNTKLYT